LTTEGNDRISSATATGLTGRTAIHRGAGIIGDNNSLFNPTTDVDLLQVQLQTGDVLQVDVDAATGGSTLDSVLRLFDAMGMELAISLDDPAPGEGASADSFVSFTVPVTGTYYIGVSGQANDGYDPLVIGSGISGSTGDYNIELTVTDPAGVLHRNEHRVNIPNVTSATQFGLPASFLEGNECQHPAEHHKTVS
jgi:hypothetical protein